jgi:putative oxidoreductase
MITKEHFFSLPLRSILGIGFIYHGFPKLFSIAGHEGFAGSLKGLGVPIPEISAWFVAGVEFFGGIFLIIGLFVFITSLILIIEMLYAMIKVHLPHGFSYIHMSKSPEGIVYGPPGVEVNLLYIAGLITLMLLGAGPLSIDYLLRRKTAEPRVKFEA